MPVGKANIDKSAEQYEADEKERSGADFFKFENGDNRIRIMPPREGSDQFFVKRATHWKVEEGGVGDDGQNFNCPRAQDKNAKCFLCAKSAELEASDDADDKKLGKELRARPQWMYAIVDLDDVDAGIQICGFPKTVHIAVGEYVRDEDYGDVTDLEEGYNLNVIRKQKKKKIDYTVKAKKNPSAAPEAIVEFLQDNDPPDLMKYAEPASQKDMRAAWEGEEPDDDDEKPAKRGKSRRAAREDDDDEDEKPSKKSKRAADDDDDGDDEAPAKKSKKSDDDEDEPKSKGKAKDEDADAAASDDDDGDDDADDDEDDGDGDDEDEAEEKPAKKSADVGKRLGQRRKGRK